MFGIGYSPKLTRLLIAFILLLVAIIPLKAQDDTRIYLPIVNHVTSLGTDKDFEYTTYAEPTYGYSFKIPVSWKVIAAPLHGVGGITKLLNPEEQVRIEIGLEIYDKPSSVSLEEWVHPNSNLAKSLQYQSSVHLKQGNGVIQTYRRDSWSGKIAYVPFENKVVFAQLIPAREEYNDIFIEIVNSITYTRNEVYSKKASTINRLYTEALSVSSNKPKKFNINFILPFSGRAKITQTGDHGLSHNCPGWDCQALDFVISTNGMDGRVYSAETGNVVFQGLSPDGYGNLVQIQHSNGWVSWYAHLSSFEPPTSFSKVVRGQWLGREGDTGCDITYNCPQHLHFMVKESSKSDSNPIDISSGLLPGLEFATCATDTNCGWGYGGPSLYRGDTSDAWSQAFGVDTPSLEGEFIGDRQTRAIRVPERWSLKLYRNKDFGGTPTIYVGPTSANIGIDVSSLKVSYILTCPAKILRSLQDCEPPPFPPPIITPVPNDTTPPTVGNYSASTSGGTANLGVSNVNDASGIREVRFSAKFNNQWVGIGNDTTAPYDMAWDMCAWGVPDGDVELGMEAWDNAGNVYIWSQHYPNPHITKSHNCAPPQQSDGIYLYPNDGLDPSRGGECRVTQDAPSITNYCGNGWNDEVESVRTVGPYRAVLFKDDWYSGGEPLYIDFTGALIDAWRNQASSIRVRRTDNPAFTLYSLGDYNGESWPSDRTIFDMGHWRWNDKAQSIRVHSGYSVIVCSDADFKSTCGRATGPNQWSDINALAQGLRDGVSSIRVCPGSCPDVGPHPTSYAPTSNQTVDATQPVSLHWGGDLNQFFVELWGGGLDSKRQFGWTNDITWNVGLLPVSTNPYYWRVKGWRGYGETGWTEGSFYVATPDTTQPTGKMTAPGRFGYRNDSTIILKAEAADSDSGVAQVEFFTWLNDQWEFLGVDTTLPYEYNWDISTVREGGLWVSANIVDNAGNNSGLIWDPDWVFFTIDYTPPSSAVLPLPETVITEQFTVRWSGADNYTPNDLIFYDVQYQLDCTGDWLDWYVMGNMGGASFNGQTGHSYCFRSRAYDLPGNTEAWSDQADARTQISIDAPTPTFTPTPTSDGQLPITDTPTPTPTSTEGLPPVAINHAIYLPSIQQNSKGASGGTFTPTPATTPAAVLLSNALVETCKWAIQMGLTGFTPNSPITVSSAYSEVTCPQGQQNSASWSQVYPSTTDGNGALVVAYLHQGTGSYTYTFTDQTGKSATLSFNTQIADTTATPVPTPLPSATPTFTPSPIPTPTFTSTPTATPTRSQLLAYAVNQDGNVDIYQMQSDGSAPKNLTNHPAFEWGPSWSPDGEQIAFVSDRDGNLEIYVMNADGSAQHRLTQNTLYDIGPVWSPDGQWIVYKSFENGDYHIYLLKPDGSGQQLLTTGANSDWRMSWSPDGTRLAFSSFRHGNGEIYLINMDGTGLTRITDEPTEDNDATWSPDGGKLAFVSRRDGNQEIYVVNIDGSNPIRLTNNPAADSIPVWSPDGQKLAFTSNRDGFDAVYLMNADGSAQTRITNGPHGSNFAVWRPK